MKAIKIFHDKKLEVIDIEKPKTLQEGDTMTAEKNTAVANRTVK